MNQLALKLTTDFNSGILPELKFIDIDVETRSEVNLKLVGAHAYSQHPSTEILLMRYWIKGKMRGWRQGEKFPLIIKRYLDKGYLIRAHSAWFEYCIWKNIGFKQMGWPNVNVLKFYCTQAMVCSHTYQPSLEDSGEQLHLPIKKDKRGQALINFFSVPSRKKTGPKWNEPKDYPDEFNEFDEYCEGDVLVQRGIVKKLPLLTADQYGTYKLTQMMNVRGVPIDIKMAKGALELKEIYIKKANEQIFKLTKGKIESVTSRKQVLEYLEKNDFNLPDLQAETVRRAIDDKDTPKKIKKILQLRLNSNKTSTAKYDSALRTIGNDGRLHGTIAYHIARTGRWGGRGFQVHNLAKTTLPKWVDYHFISDLIRDKQYDIIEIMYGEIMEVLASCVRALIKAPKGKKFIAADYAQIEARILFWLADETDAINALLNDLDLYCDLASDIYQRHITKKDEDERFVGKNAILGLGFGMGWKKFQNTVYEQAGIRLSNEFCRKVVKIYRKKYRKVKKLWDKTESAAINAVKHPGRIYKCANGKIKYQMEGRYLYCILPSGRKMAYVEPKIEYVKKPWSDELGPKLTYMGYDSFKRKWRRVDTYGGKLVENYVQASATDIMSNGMKTAEKSGYYQIFTVHDESISEVEEDFGSVEEYENLLCQLPIWASGCPIKAEGWSDTIYRKG